MRTVPTPTQLIRFERILKAGGKVRVSKDRIWRALARVFPHRQAGSAERELLLDVLQSLEERESVRLPPVNGRRWDRTMIPHVPTSIDQVPEEREAQITDWRSFPWHRKLSWVPELHGLSVRQVNFLYSVQRGVVNGEFAEKAPLKYRSLQLTGDEKALEALTRTSLFGPGRLTMDTLGCMPDALPLAWEIVGNGGRMLIFENAGPFAVARRVLLSMKDAPYGLVGYGGGKSVVAALGHIQTIERAVEAIYYVGDLDVAGLEIASDVKTKTRQLRLPIARAATQLHRAMLQAAADLGSPGGWHAGKKSAPDPGRVKSVAKILDSAIKPAVKQMLIAGCRIPEEVLGPEEMRAALKAE